MKRLDPDERERLITGLASDYRALDLEPADRAMLDYADKLTRTAREMNAADVERLRAAGFGERAIHDICVIAAYFAFVNRVANGLGIKMEGEA